MLTLDAGTDTKLDILYRCNGTMPERVGRVNRNW